MPFQQDCMGVQLLKHSLKNRTTCTLCLIQESAVGAAYSDRWSRFQDALADIITLSAGPLRAAIQGGKEAGGNHEEQGQV